MSELLDKQVKAFGDAIVGAHVEAMAFWHVQELVFLGVSVADVLSRSVEARRAKAALDPALAAYFAGAARQILASLCDGDVLVGQMESRGFQVEGVTDYRDAIGSVPQASSSPVDRTTTSPPEWTTSSSPKRPPARRRTGTRKTPRPFEGSANPGDRPARLRVQ
jgi:hypothetical protein